MAVRSRRVARPSGRLAKSAELDEQVLVLVDGDGAAAPGSRNGAACTQRAGATW